MKKLFALLLVAILTLSLVACGNSNAEQTPSNNDSSANVETEVNAKDDKANYIGVWDNGNYFRLTITKGGVGSYESLMSGKEKYDLEWEVTDEVIVIRISGYAGMEHKAVLELSDDMSSLVALQNGFPAFVEGEDTFTKQQ